MASQVFRQPHADPRHCSPLPRRSSTPTRRFTRAHRVRYPIALASWADRSVQPAVTVTRKRWWTTPTAGRDSPSRTSVGVVDTSTKGDQVMGKAAPGYRTYAEHAAHRQACGCREPYHRLW